MKGRREAFFMRCARAQVLAPVVFSLMWGVFLIEARAQGIASQARVANNSVFDVILDIDWTLYNTVNPYSLSESATDVLTIGGQQYRSSPGLLDLLETLYSDGRFRVSILSGGPRERNQELIEQTYRKLRDRMAARGQSVNWAPFATGHVDDLVATSPTGARFSDRYKKDLDWLARVRSQADPPVDLDRAVLVDDVKGFVLDGQNQLWMSATYDEIIDFDTWVMKGKPGALKYPPPGYHEWFLDRHRLVWVQEILLRAADDYNPRVRSFGREIQLHALDDLRASFTVKGLDRNRTRVGQGADQLYRMIKPLLQACRAR